jgi:hypothetical protein
VANFSRNWCCMRRLPSLERGWTSSYSVSDRPPTGKAALNSWQLWSECSDDERTNWFSFPIVIPEPEFLPQPRRSSQEIPDFVAWSSVFPGVQIPPSMQRTALPTQSQYAATAGLALNAVAVTATGRHSGEFRYAIQNLTIESTQPANSLVTNQARRQIANQFRPVLVEGSVVSGSEIRLNYVFPPGPVLTMPVSAR